MNIISIEHIEDCFDGSLLRAAHFDAPVSADFITFLCESSDGMHQYLREFQRPFYKVDFVDHFLIEGVQAMESARVLVSRRNPDGDLPMLRALINDFNIRSKSVSFVD